MTAIQHTQAVVDILGVPTTLELHAPHVPDPDFWLICAYYAPGGWWKMHSGLYATREAAELEAQRLLGCYSRRMIIHIGSPSAEETP